MAPTPQLVVRRGEHFLSSLRTTLMIDDVADAPWSDQCGLPQPGRVLRIGVALE